jgi:hypothetical protein
MPSVEKKKGKHCQVLKERRQTLPSVETKKANIAKRGKKKGKHCQAWEKKERQTMSSVERKKGKHYQVLREKGQTLLSIEITAGKRISKESK